MRTLWTRGPAAMKAADGDGGGAATTTSPAPASKPITTLDELSERLQHDVVGQINALKSFTTDEVRKIRDDMDARFKETADARRKEALPGYDPSGGGDPGKRFNLRRACWGALTRWDGETPFGDARKLPEYEPLVEYARAQQHGFGSKGGLLVPMTWMQDMIDALKPSSIALSLGAHNETGVTGGPIGWRRSDGGVTAYRKGESKPATPSENAYSMFTLSPKELIAMVNSSRSLFQQTGPTFQASLERDLAREIGLKMDLDLFVGKGSESTPRGIFNAPGVQTVNFGTPALDLAGSDQNATNKLDQFIEKLMTANAYAAWGPVAWVGHPSAFFRMRELKDANGNPILFDSKMPMTDNAGVGAGLFWGHRFGMSTQLPYGSDTVLGLVAFGAVYNAIWDTLEIAVSEEAGDTFDNNDIKVRAVVKQDSGVLRGEHVCKSTGWSN